MLRKKLANVAKISDFKDDILAKLMILEYAEPKLFEILYNWQMSNEGVAAQLEELEKICSKKDNAKISFPDKSKEWNKPKIINWLCSEPFLSKIDLRDYFWISRDKLSSMQSNLLVSPIVKALMEKLYPINTADKFTKQVLTDEVKALSNQEQISFFNLLKRHIVTEPDRKRNYDIFNLALEVNLDCQSIYIESLSSVGKKLPPAVKESLKRFVDSYPEFNQFINEEQKRK
jgi:hypothetical protein